MRKLLYVITLSEYGGAQSQVAELMTAFASKYKVMLATSQLGPLTEHAATLNIPVHILRNLKRSVNPLSDMAAIRECKELFCKLQPDLIHLHSSKAGIVGRIAAQQMRIPVIYTAHGWGFKPGVPLVRRCLIWLSEKLVAPAADKIICVSEFDRQLAINWKVGTPKNIITILNGIPDIPKLAEPSGNPPTIVMTARFQEPKDQPLLLRAFAKYCSNSSRLMFIGGGPFESDSKRLTNVLGLDSRVSFLGDRHDVADLLARAQIFALVSKYEGLPISILEAMRAGLPVIASKVGGVIEEVDDGITGFLISEHTIEAIGLALNTLCNSSELRTNLGRAGRYRYLAHFTKDRMIAATGDIYDQLAGILS